ncbi:hypothetical protein [Flavobacterium wongokense]|uniref:hypothetical protein n=1 Tax=Flavobacterium wongokense TaxID=2910674 RepID=UPI001F3BA5AE|nr:hypothetical protein [Flavobacterium sp. WG47]MCF6131108.1 hypothetical protein [Flavobacterium sp. WG47]
MDDKIKELSDKLDKVLENQELILKQLAQSTILTKEPVQIPKKKTSKKELVSQKIEEFKLTIEHGHRLQAKYNLAVVPHTNRILAYLRTNDDSVFDGLKRNN